MAVSYWRHGMKRVRVQVIRREDVIDLLLIVVKKRIYFLCRLRDGRKKLAPEEHERKSVC